MHFASDNAGPVHPSVLDALGRANDGYAMPYGAEAAMDDLRSRLRDLFEAPKAAIYLVATGTAANALLLASLCQPWQRIYCADVAHIEEDECGAPEFFTNAAKLSLIDSPDGLMGTDALARAVAATPQGDVHGVQRWPLSLTNLTERGTLYDLGRLRALTRIARAHGMPVHLDGARLANAIAALGCTPAEMTWKSGIDAVSFGGTKNGLMGVEAAILFDPDKAWEFELRRKRGAHLFSKHRFLSAQMQAYLADDLWLDMARGANDAAARLAAGLRDIGHVRLLHEPAGNMIFAEWPRAGHRRLRTAGAQYYMQGPADGPDDEMIGARMVCDWSATAQATDRFLSILRG